MREIEEDLGTSSELWTTERTQSNVFQSWLLLHFSWTIKSPFLISMSNSLCILSQHKEYIISSQSMRMLWRRSEGAFYLENKYYFLYLHFFALNYITITKSHYFFCHVDKYSMRSFVPSNSVRLVGGASFVIRGKIEPIFSRNSSICKTNHWVGRQLRNWDNFPLNIFRSGQLPEAIAKCTGSKKCVQCAPRKCSRRQFMSSLQ